jgi:hypothetical protein
VIQSAAVANLPLRQVPRTIIEAAFRSSRENKRFMTYYQVEPQSSGEMERLRAANQEIANALDAYFQLLVSQGQLPPFDTAVYAEQLNNLVSNTLKQCFALEQGEREEFYREGVIELVERLFFGPPLAGDEQASAGRDSR